MAQYYFTECLISRYVYYFFGNTHPMGMQNLSHLEKGGKS